MDSAVRHTVISHSRLRMRELRLEAARGRRHGLKVMTFEQLAARLAGGLAQPVDDDALREAITGLLPGTALGELDGIKALPGMVSAADILMRRMLDFCYRARPTGQTSRQRAEPYGLIYGNRAFLVARNEWKDEPRLWRVTSMHDARLLNERFERDPAFDLQRYARRSFGTFQEKPVRVVLRFDAGAAPDAASFLFHPGQTVEEYRTARLRCASRPET